MHHAIMFNCHVLDVQRTSGAYRIASFLRQEGWDVEVIEWAALWHPQDLMRLVKSRVTNNTVFFGFSTFFSVWTVEMEHFAQWVKRTYPDIKLVLGGQSKPRIDSHAIDYFVHGYGEIAILELCKSFIGNTSIGGIKFDPAFTNKKVISAIHSYPAYPLKSLKTIYEDRDFLEPYEWVTLEFARGCKFKCIFCNFPILGVKGDYSRDAEDFYEEVEDIHDRFGVKHFYIADETFNDSSDKIEKFAKVTDRLSFTPYMTGHIRADLMVARPQDWDNMIKLGINGHFYGIETFNHETGKAIGKGMSPDKLQEGLLKIREYFLKHTGVYRGNISMIAGLPYETEKTLIEAHEWLMNEWKGENFSWNLLEIPFDYKNDVLSQLSLDYGKYGYRVSEKGYDNYGQYDHMGCWHAVKQLDWENDNLSRNKCIEILRNQLQDGKYFSQTTISPWFLYVHMLDTKQSFKEILNQKIDYFRSNPSYGQHIKKLSDEHIGRYVERKLAL